MIWIMLLYQGDNINVKIYERNNINIKSRCLGVSRQKEYFLGYNRTVVEVDGISLLKLFIPKIMSFVIVLSLGRKQTRSEI